MSKILDMITFEEKTQGEVSAELAQRLRARRKEQGLSQAELAARSGVSLGSLKRFELQHEISLTSLVKLAIALGYQGDFDSLFARRSYGSIEEVIADARIEFGR